jgi:hypothetical protein
VQDLNCGCTAAAQVVGREKLRESKESAACLSAMEERGKGKRVRRISEDFSEDETEDKNNKKVKG